VCVVWRKHFIKFVSTVGGSARAMATVVMRVNVCKCFKNLLTCRRRQPRVMLTLHVYTRRSQWPFLDWMD